MDNRFNKWNKWLDVIYLEIRSLSVNRNIFWEVQNIIKNNPKIQKPSSFYEFLGSTYVISALMGVRRQIKINKDSISFAKLLKEICATPEILSRDRFVVLYKGSAVEHLANRHFDKFAGKVGSHIDPDLVRLKLKELKIKAWKCEKFADQRIAHFDKRANKNIPTFKDLDDCIDFLEELIKMCYLLFRAVSLTSILPVYQYDWKAIFREPWLL
jgi:hypothetical protein